MSSPDKYFDAHAYYLFTNPADPGKQANIDSTGQKFLMTDDWTDSSQNWQIYHQRGRWFIRPYSVPSDKSEWVDYQLGLAIDSSSGSVGRTPKLRERNGETGQQWVFTKVDGGFRISNELLGEEDFLSARGGDFEQPPVMQSSGGGGGSVWNVSINANASAPRNANSYQPLRDFEVKSSSTSVSSVSRSTSTSAPTGRASSSSMLTTPTSTPTSASASAASASPSTGAVAGIAVGVGIIAICTAIGAFLFVRRRKKRRANTAVEVASDTKTTYRYEIDSPAVVHMAQEKNFMQPRFELGTDAAAGDQISKIPEPALTDGRH